MGGGRDLCPSLREIIANRAFVGWLAVDAGGRGRGPPPEDHRCLIDQLIQEFRK